MKLPFLSLAPIAGLLFIVGSLTVVVAANIYLQYPLFHPMIP
jgi:hypothetical protein